MARLAPGQSAEQEHFTGCGITDNFFPSLSSDSPLPRGFDGVALSTKEKERVVKCRKNPYRQEIDIDDRGVINTEYIEEEEMV